MNRFNIITIVLTVFAVFVGALFANKFLLEEKPLSDLPTYPSIFRDYNKPIDLPNKDYDIPIITYHYVEVVKDPKDYIRKSLSVTPQTFESHLSWLAKKGYNPIFIKEVPDIVSGKLKLSKPIALTFDDGYRDFYTDAFPALKKYNIKATVYIITGFIGAPNYMTKAQIEEVSKNNLIEIGSHTKNHVSLVSINEQTAKDEIQGSKFLLEDLFKIKVETFAYPYGFYNTSIQKLVKGAGYTAAVTIVLGKTQNQKNIYLMPRIRSGGFYQAVN